MEIPSLWLLAGGALLIFIGAVIGGILGSMLFNVFFHKQIIRQTSSERAVNVRAEKAERINAALIEAANMFQEGKPVGDIAKELLPKYPDVALDLVKKLGKGKGLGGLIPTESSE